MVPIPVWAWVAAFVALVYVFAFALLRASALGDRAYARAGPRCPECDAAPGAACEAWCSSWSTRP